MSVLVVIGLSLEVAGGILLASEIVLAERWEVASRGMTFPSSESPIAEAQTSPARGIVGLTLLCLGFAVQLVGYVVESLWFWPLSALIAVGAFFAGRKVADTYVRRRLHRQAQSYWEELRAQKYSGDSAT